MQIKTTVRYHLTPVKMAIVKKFTNNKRSVLARVWKKGNPYTLLEGMWVGTATFEKSIEVLKKLKIELPVDPAMLLLDIYPKKLKSGSWRVICTLMFIAALFTIAKTWKQPKCLSTDEWIKKVWCICSGNIF